MKAQNLALSVDVQTSPYDAALVNEISGATAFYEKGVYGQNASVANIELGVYWPEHHFLADSVKESVLTPEGAVVSDLYSSHATATAALIAGYNADNSSQIPYLLSFGIAPKAALHAAAVARQINPDGTANVESADFYAAYKNFFSVNPVDCINSSWGSNSTDPSAYMPLAVDALSCANAKTTMIISAGNEGPEENTVSSMSLSFNTIVVGALANNKNSFDTIADYSSRSPSNFYNPVTKEIISAVRPAVDISAPGSDIAVAYYDSAQPETKDFYAVASGTSFSAPVVAGVATLLKSTSYELEKNQSFVDAGWTSDARDTRVIKAVILNSAKKPADWTNNMSLQNGVNFNIELGGGSYYSTSFDNIHYTTQALDYTYGTGILDGSAALEQYIGAWTSGTSNNVWLLDTVDYTSSKMYKLGVLKEGSTLTATMVWFVKSLLKEADETTDEPAFENNVFANLALELWTEKDGQFEAVALSDCMYNNVEHFSITITNELEYYLRISFFEMLYGQSENETFALAWSIIPEPSAFAALCGFLCIVFVAVKPRKNIRK